MSTLEADQPASVPRWLPQGDRRFLIVALIAIVVLAVLSVIAAPATPTPALSVRSSKRDGALALRLWLERSGYAVQEVPSLNHLDAVDTLFLLEPIIFYNENDALRLQRWVQTGHRLIVAGEPFSVNILLQPYEVELRFLSSGVETVTPAAPTLLNPPLSALNAQAFAYVQGQRPAVVTHLVAGEAPILVSFAEGQGQVWVFGALRPFSNRGLQDPGSAELIANLLAGLPSTTVIGFDEGGHGFSDLSEQSLAGWLSGTPPGWGILLGFGLTLVYLASRGRRFGRALPLPDERWRRQAVEYIQAMGTLFRRSGQRAEILQHYRAQLRRRLSERYGIEPGLDAEAMIESVAARDPALDTTALRNLMNALSQTQVSEQALLKTIAEVDAFLRRWL